MYNHVLGPAQKQNRQVKAAAVRRPLRGLRTEPRGERCAPPLRADEHRGGTDKRFTPRLRWAGETNGETKT